jgi:hypothetical protein
MDGHDVLLWLRGFIINHVKNATKKEGLVRGLPFRWSAVDPGLFLVVEVRALPCLVLQPADSSSGDLVDRGNGDGDGENEHDGADDDDVHDGVLSMVGVSL